MNKVIWFGVVALLVSFCLIPAFAQTKYTISTPGFDHPVAVVASKVLPDAYKQLGFDVEFQSSPPARATAMFDDNSVDAYIFADASFLKAHPKAIMVNSPIGYDDIVVFTKKDNITVKGWDSLKSYTIGYMIGMAVIEDNIKDMKGGRAQDPAQAFKKLDADRTDIVVMPRGVGLIMIKNLNLRGVKILDPPLEKVALYHFVTNKNAAFAPKLADILAGLSKSGKLKSITDQVEADFLK